MDNYGLIMDNYGLILDNYGLILDNYPKIVWGYTPFSDLTAPYLSLDARRAEGHLEALPQPGEGDRLGESAIQI